MDKLYKNNESGLTLIEITASIVLISIIFIGFFSLLITSKKVGVASEDIVDATYITQQAMEEVYLTSSNMNLEEIVNYYLTEKNSAHTTYTATNNNNFTITFNHDFNNLLLSIQFLKHTQPSLSLSLPLYNITITTKENGTTKSTMENIMSIKP